VDKAARAKLRQNLRAPAVIVASLAAQAGLRDPRRSRYFSSHWRCAFAAHLRVRADVLTSALSNLERLAQRAPGKVALVDALRCMAERRRAEARLTAAAIRGTVA